MTRMSRWIPLAAVLALLGAAMLAGVFANPVIGTTPASIVTRGGAAQTQETELQPAQTGGPVKPDDFAGGQLLVRILLFICALAVLIVLAAMLWMALRHRFGVRRDALRVAEVELPQPSTQERVRRAVDEGLSDLDDLDADPRRAVIACWVRLEAAAAAAGTAREPGDTSTELVQRLLSSHAVSGRVLDDFAAVYREARFATHTVDVAMRDQARAALRQLRDELSVGAR
jgi:hypothetical protein